MNQYQWPATCPPIVVITERPARRADEHAAFSINRRRQWRGVVDPERTVSDPATDYREHRRQKCAGACRANHQRIGAFLELLPRRTHRHDSPSAESTSIA